LKANRTASILRVKMDLGRPDRPHQGGMNIKLHAVIDSDGRPLSLS